MRCSGWEATYELPSSASRKREQGYACVHAPCEGRLSPSPQPQPIGRREHSKPPGGDVVVSLAQPEPRGRMLRVRCTATEYRRWQALAASYDGTLSGMVRLLLEGVPPLRHRQMPTTDPELIRQLAMLGNNMNQIARAVNAAHVAGARLFDRHPLGSRDHRKAASSTHE